MNLKPLVASMALLASGAALAAGFEAPPMVIDRLELQRNHNGRFAEPNDWFRRITLSGELNVDGMWSDRTTGDNSGTTPITRFSHHSSSDLSVSNANIYLGARVNNWVMANIDLQLNDNFDGGVFRGNPHQLAWDQDATSDTLDEAYLTIGDFRQSPFYLLLGKEYVPYGYYVRHPVIAPVTQLMTQTNATAVQLGFVDISGFNGSIFAFRNKVPHAIVADAGGNFDNDARRVENGGLQIGYRYDQRDMGINLDLSWLANMNDVDYLSNFPSDLIPTGQGQLTQYKSVPAATGVIQGHYMGFDGQIQYTTALRHFSTLDMVWKGKGAMPEAWLVGAGYSFPVWDHNTRLGLNYQKTRQAVDFGTKVGMPGLPRERWQVDYTINAWKNTDVILAYYHDKDYIESNTGSVDDNVLVRGTGGRKNTAVVRVAAKFV